MYQYLIYDKKNGSCFYTDWYCSENNFNPGMIVFNLQTGMYTEDGIVWSEIDEDHL